MASVEEIEPIDCIEGLPHPRMCNQLVGHKNVEDEFLSSFNGGRFHHAWLLTGPKGVGKASFAYRAAKFLLANGQSGGGLFGPPETLDVDSGSPDAHLIQSGLHPALKILKREYDLKGKKYFSVIRVDDVRALSSFFGLKTSGDGWRVVIVDTVDDMNNNAANALLKVLEEPPEKTVFMLISHAPAGLLPTIRSRCRKVQFSTLSETNIRTVLQEILPGDERIGDPALPILADGSPGRAALMLQNGGLEVFASILDIFRGYPNYDGQMLHDLADICGKKNAETTYQLFCEIFPWWISRLVRMSSASMSGQELLAGEAELFKTLTAQRPVDFWIHVWERANERISDADRINLDKKQIVLDLFLIATLNK
ncbi:DNA polymerase III subunit delta' [Sneathiella sp. P13V-1]|uniref:DNA polymerase III subunit delta' n=1 Tax=Sneathiella sp. P13V-1 TaxID=2697366 RepID=UPI00187BACA0|nr:DNA polymerase III subunit delta' [Sneathiella sp. P13V-1]MBE7637346.1 DNA polymerase III subunit delta' [Sneathiella sp. P13V-1]